MSTLDSTLSIQSPVAPAPTTSTQSKPTQGFQQFLEDATQKVSNPAPKAKVNTAISRPPSETLQTAKALQSAGRRTDQAKGQPASDSNDIDSTEKPTSRVVEAQSETSPKRTQRRSVVRDSKSEVKEDSGKVQAESTQRQDLPSETAEEVSGPAVLAPAEGAANTVESQDPVPVAQTASAVALLASLLVQTTGDLRGTPVAVGAKPQIAESATGGSAPAPPTIVQPGTLSTRADASFSSATPISPEVLDGPPLPEVTQGVPTYPAAIVPQAPTTAPAEALNLAAQGGSSAKGAPADFSAETEQIISEPVPSFTQEVAAAQAEPVPQNSVQTRVQQTAPITATAKPAAAEKRQKLSKSQGELPGKEELPELEVSPELLTSRSLSLPGTEAATADTSSKDGFSSKQQDAKPENVNVVQLKSMVVANKEILRTQPVLREVQEAKDNVTHQIAEVAFFPQNQGTATKASQETSISAVPVPETASSSLSVPEPGAPSGGAESAAKAVGTPHANVNWGQVEKAQVVSQIVERAHLLGKNQSELMVVLKPEFLGKVNLHAAMVDNQLVATIVAESASVKQMLESQLNTLQTALHEQGLPAAKVEVVQGSQLSFADLGAGQSSSQQHLESGKSQLPPSLSRYETREEAADAVPQETRIYAPPTSRSLNLVA